MKELFQRWLTKQPKLNGLKACGICFPDHECVIRTHSDELTTEQFHEILASLCEIAPSLATRGTPGQRQRWAFDRASLNVAVRPDGVILAAVTTTEADGAATSRMLESFSTLTQT